MSTRQKSSHLTQKTEEIWGGKATREKILFWKSNECLANDCLRKWRNLKQSKYGLITWVSYFIPFLDETNDFLNEIIAYYDSQSRNLWNQRYFTNHYLYWINFEWFNTPTHVFRRSEQRSKTTHRDQNENRHSLIWMIRLNRHQFRLN